MDHLNKDAPPTTTRIESDVEILNPKFKECQHVDLLLHNWIIGHAF